MIWNTSWGYNDRYGLEVGLFTVDPIDFEVHGWDWISVKLLVKAFGFHLYLVGLEIGRDRTSVGLCNCFVAVFYR